mmetsp:Transcript_21206/g.73011  ORF Transcript_21206/g.73011 Transcript_21206/m.73011 type:complete len:234 (-) Transcript_21206:843-1544(-)
MRVYNGRLPHTSPVAARRDVHRTPDPSIAATRTHARRALACSRHSAANMKWQQHRSPLRTNIFAHAFLLGIALCLGGAAAGVVLCPGGTDELPFDVCSANNWPNASADGAAADWAAAWPPPSAAPTAPLDLALLSSSELLLVLPELLLELCLSSVFAVVESSPSFGFFLGLPRVSFKVFSSPVFFLFGTSAAARSPEDPCLTACFLNSPPSFSYKLLRKAVTSSLVSPASNLV